ncbi:MAG TPA: tetraacyldisaccharide 4'-kinase [Thermoanaerobaculia bacterium]|nr:tetraacyldisaccharide 4'-kinase [Thermoanaerobaculia bacterium]
MRLPTPPPPTSLWQRAYGAAHRLRGRWWTERAGRLSRPVISIGNLHFGGSGKTPLTAAIAAHFRDQGRKVCILSRGYASQGRGVRIVSDGGGPLLAPHLAGDEPVLLAAELPGVAVVVGPDRLYAGLQALHRLSPPPDLFLLDDGFSHLALRRDLDLLAFPAADPFAGGKLLPGGRLREPLSASARADAVLLTGAPDSVAGGGGLGDQLGQALRPYGFTGPGFASRTLPGAPRFADGRILPPGALVFLISAIARPDSFAETARALGYEIRGELRFGDHFAYPDASLAKIQKAFAESGAQAVLATTKDGVKLRGRLTAPLAELPVRAEPEPAFWRWLDEALARIEARRRSPGAFSLAPDPADGPPEGAA